MSRRRHHYRRRTGNTYEIDVTTFLNLMVVLVPFLLITAVFSRLTIVELNLPSTAGGANNQADSFRVEVIVREQGVEISNGSAIIATVPKSEDGEYDLEALSDMMVSLKQEYPEQEPEATALSAPWLPHLGDSQRLGGWPDHQSTDPHYMLRLSFLSQALCAEVVGSSSISRSTV